MFKRKSAKAKPTKDKPKKPAKAAATSGVVLQKAETDVYTVMLIISFVAVLIACLLLWLELSTYGSYPWWTAS